MNFLLFLGSMFSGITCQIALKYCQANPLTKFATNFTTDTTYRIVSAIERK